VSNGRVNAELHATSRNLVAALPRWAVAQSCTLLYCRISLCRVLFRMTVALPIKIGDTAGATVRYVFEVSTNN
jgi:hypothetical protein